MTTDTQRRRREAAYRKGFEDGRAERLAGSRAVVKPLEWNSGKFGHSVESPFGTWWVRNPLPCGTIVLEGPFGHSEHPNAEAAKAAAQSDYERRILSALTEPDGEAHPDDLAVDRFAAAMKAKLAKKRNEGRGGWDNREECTAEHLSYLLIQHCLKGDPLDVGNLAMMLHQLGDRIVIDDETASIMRRPELAGEAPPAAQLVSDAMVEAFQSKYREFWKGSWPDRNTSIELIEAVLGAQVAQ